MPQARLLLVINEPQFNRDRHCNANAYHTLLDVDFLFVSHSSRRGFYCALMITESVSSYHSNLHLVCSNCSFSPSTCCMAVVNSMAVIPCVKLWRKSMCILNGMVVTNNGGRVKEIMTCPSRREIKRD